jgi:hypothetical protein
MSFAWAIVFGLELFSNRRTRDARHDAMPRTASAASALSPA